MVLIEKQWKTQTSMLVAGLLAYWSTAVLNKPFCEKYQAMAPQGVIEKQWETQKSMLVAGWLACWSTAVLNKPFCEKSQAGGGSLPYG